MDSFIYNDIMPVGEPTIEWNPKSSEITINQAFKTEPANKYDKILVCFSFYKNGKIIGSKQIYIEADGYKKRITAKLPEEPDVFELEFLSAEKFPDISTDLFPEYQLFV